MHTPYVVLCLYSQCTCVFLLISKELLQLIFAENLQIWDCHKKWAVSYWPQREKTCLPGFANNRALMEISCLSLYESPSECLLKHF